MEDKEYLKQKLFEKIEKEYKEYMENLLKCDYITIFDNAYENVLKGELKYNLKTRDYEINEIKALLKCSNVLQECFEEWLKTDVDFNEVLEGSVNKRIDIITNDYMKEKAKRNKESR